MENVGNECDGEKTTTESAGVTKNTYDDQQANIAKGNIAPDSLISPQKSKIAENPSSLQNKKQNIKNIALRKLNEKSRIVGTKLGERRIYLETQAKALESNREARENNDQKALKILKSMKNGDLSCSTNISGIQENIDVIGAASTKLSLQRHSKRQLQDWVEGFYELFTKLTANDIGLKSKVQHLADNISSLQGFPLFVTDDNSSSTAHKTKFLQPNNDDHIEHSHDSLLDDTERNSTTAKTKDARNKADKNERKVKTPELSPQEMLLNYINTMLSSCLGSQQQDKFDKVKCTPDRLDDLEKYAQSLVQADLGRVVEEEIRVNRKNNRQSFISLSNNKEYGMDMDGIIQLPVARRYAFDGDVVRAFVLHPKTAGVDNNKNGSDDCRKPRRISNNILGGKENSICLPDDEDACYDCDSSPDTDMDDNAEILETAAMIPENLPKAFVINIVKQRELREVVGAISFKKITSINSKSYYTLIPHDMRVPMIYIPAETCQDAVGSDDVVGMLYLANILETDNNGHYIGELIQPVGRVGNLEAEMKAILIRNGLKDLKPYDQKFHDMYDGPMAPITDDDLKHREDLRNKCIFTIDPLTARDLDDAMSVDKLSEDEYEIGVHISDVSHYLQENSELDTLVKDRATSIYLVNEVIHMLPSSLCYRCSLLPGEDKFAFSVFWRWNINTKMLSEPRFTRSVINSCAQFAYEHAQKIIDNPKEQFSVDDFPEIFNKWTPGDIMWRVLFLNSIAQDLKAKRFESGALSINNPKLRFSLDPITGEPISYEIEGRQEANYLIEEFMLLANQAVAKFIHQHYPDTSILRNHAPPVERSMRALKERLANVGLDFDISSSKSIYESMQRLSRESSDPKAMNACLSTLLTKPMSRARYYCSEGKTSDADFWHYALSIPIYTHFTSPIRRYPDILVHRLLAASLKNCPPPQRTADELHKLAKNCNDKKFSAKTAGDESIDLFFTRYIRAKESITLMAVVTDIFKHMLSVVTIDTGHTFNISYKLQKVNIDATNVPSFVLISEKNSQLPPIKLQLFSTVGIRVVLRNNKTCGFIVSPDKTQRRYNSKESSKLREKNTNNSSTANGNRKYHNSNSEQEENTEKGQKVPKTRKKKERVYSVKGDE